MPTIHQLYRLIMNDLANDVGSVPEFDRSYLSSFFVFEGYGPEIRLSGGFIQPRHNSQDN